MLRASGGETRRINSVSRLRHGGDVSTILPDFEGAFAALGQDSLFRVTGLAPEADGQLAARGYVAEGESCTLLAPLASMPFDGGATRLLPVGDAGWITARIRISGGTEAELRDAIASVPLPGTLAAAFEGDRIVAVAFGALDRGLLVVEAVATDPTARRRGHARAVVAALMVWAHGRGATHACLQVSADNDAARRLYAGLGFGQELYRYHYRRRALSDLRRPE